MAKWVRYHIRTFWFPFVTHSSNSSTNTYLRGKLNCWKHRYMHVLNPYIRHFYYVKKKVIMGFCTIHKCGCLFGTEMNNLISLGKQYWWSKSFEFPAKFGTEFCLKFHRPEKLCVFSCRKLCHCQPIHHPCLPVFPNTPLSGEKKNLDSNQMPLIQTPLPPSQLKHEKISFYWKRKTRCISFHGIHKKSALLDQMAFPIALTGKLWNAH